MSDVKHCRLLILGSGPAGYTAAVSRTDHRQRTRRPINHHHRCRKLARRLRRRTRPRFNGTDASTCRTI